MDFISNQNQLSEYQGLEDNAHKLDQFIARGANQHVTTMYQWA